MDDGTAEYEASLVDLSTDEQWVNPEITNAVNALQEALYSAGCTIVKTDIAINEIPGDVATINGDYGTVTIRGVDD